jgi:hypothetical protein
MPRARGRTRRNFAVALDLAGIADVDDHDAAVMRDLMASAALMVSISALAASMERLMPVWMVWAGIPPLIFLRRYSGRCDSIELRCAIAHRRISVDLDNLEIPGSLLTRAPE